MKQLINEAIIQSMTPQERREPGIINGSRKKRIAKGSGNQLEEINEVGYLLRTTAVYGNGKFGMSDFFSTKEQGSKTA